MVSRFSHLFASPQFPDEEKTRVARLLNFILLGTLAVTLIIIFLQPLYSPDPVPRLIFIAMFSALEIGGLWMIRRGRVRLMVNLLPAAMWLLLTVITFYAGGVRTTSFISYTILIVIASLLGGGRVGIGYAALSIFTGLGFLMGELNGWLPPAVIPTTPVSIYVGLTVNFLIASLLLHLATSSIAEALDQAHRNEKDLQERNLQLRAQAEALKRRETALQKANRANQTRSECIQATVRRSDESALLQDFCRILVEVGGYRLAWIGYAEQEKNKSVKPMAQMGFEEGYLDSADISWDDSAQGRGPTATTIRTGQPVIIQDISTAPDYEPWRLEATRRGYAASIALPLANGQGVFGALNLYSDSSDSFDDDETRLLGEITDDLEHGIQALRTAHALQANEARYRGIVEDQTEMIVRWQPDGTRTFVNASYCRYYDQPYEALVGTSFYPLVVAEDQEMIRQKVAALTPASPVAMDEHRSLTPAGEISWQQWIDRGIFDAAGSLVEIQSVGRDITSQKQAEEALKSSAHRLSTLHEIDQAILEADSADEIVETTLQNLRNLIPEDQCFVSFFNFEKKSLHYRNGLERNKPGQKIEKDLLLNTVPSIERLQNGEIYPILDPETGELSTPARYILGDAGFKSGFMMPILSKDGFVGTINLASQKPDAFSTEHFEIAQEVANSLGVALQTARLVNSLQRSTRQLETLRQASLQLTSDLALQPVLSGVLEYALTLTTADDAHIFLYDDSKDLLTFGTAHWAGDRQEQPYAELRPEGLTYTVARGGQRIVAPDVNRHPLFKDWPWGGAIIGLPLRHGKRVNGVMTIAFDQPHNFPEDEIRVLELLADQAAIAIENARLFQSVTDQSAQLRDLTAQVASLEEEERKRLTRELHDRVGQNLTALSINLNMAKSLLPADLPADLGLRLDESQRLVDETAQHIRDVMAELRPPVLDDYGLLAALRWYCDRFARRTGIQVRVEGLEVTPRQTLAAETALFRISQEALNNISRHAAARSVELFLHSTTTEVVLTIVDEGVGFDPALPENNAGWGMRIMRERAESVQGNLAIESSPGKGTRIMVRLRR